MLPSARWRGFVFSLPAFFLLMTAVPGQSQTQASCKFELFKLPQSVASQPNGATDNGTLVGLAVDQSGGERGFTRSPAGAVTYYSAPGSEPTYRSYTYFTGRNDNAVRVGNYAENKTGAVQKGFILNGSSFTSLAFPNTVRATYANGINKWNSVVGYYIDSIGNGHAHGFKRFSNGSFTVLNFPRASQTFATAISDRGAIVGYYFSSSHPSGFMYLNGAWATLDFPNATATTLNGISDAGVIIGTSNTSRQGTAFLYANGAFKVISVPNSFSTTATGISSNGLITGRTNLDNTASGWRGFTATCK